MFRRQLAALVAALVWIGTPAAHAQTRITVPGGEGLSKGVDYDLTDKAGRVDERTRIELLALHKTAVDALQARDFVAAEKTLTDLVRRSPTTTDANFLMGLAKIGLDKWEGAKVYLELAIQKEPLRPEPKTRLGLVYAKLNNPDGARKLREELVNLDSACNRTCEDATWIADGLVLLDEALAPKTPVKMVAATGTPGDLSAELKNFKPADYSLVAFRDIHELYNLLTKDGRCPPKKLAEPRQPCALILYRPVKGGDEGLTANFKPVFSVISRTAIWAIHDKKLQKIGIENLYFDEQDIIGQGKKAYISVALVGNAENKANCEKGLPCLNSLVVQDMFRMYNDMPDSVVAVIWGEHMKDPTTIRIR